MSDLSLTLEDQLNLKSVEIVVSGILLCNTVNKERIEHLQIVKERIERVICSFELQCEEKGVD